MIRRAIATGLAAALALTSASARAGQASECNITYSADDQLTALIGKEKFSDQYFNQLCPWLEANKLELSMTSEAGVLEQRAYAWISVRVLRADNRITGGRSSQSTVIRQTATDDEAYSALREALDSALVAMTGNLDSYLNDLVKIEKEFGLAR